MKPAELRAWIKQRRLSHDEAARTLALSVSALRKNLYGVTQIGAQTARIISLLAPDDAEKQITLTVTADGWSHENLRRALFGS